MAARIKTGDVVVVVSGKAKPYRDRDSGKLVWTKGRVLKVMAESDRVLVEGVNLVKRHTRPSPQQPEGGILQKEMPIHASNVMLWDEKAERPTRVRFQVRPDGTKVRIAVRSGESLDG